MFRKKLFTFIPILKRIKLSRNEFLIQKQRQTVFITFKTFIFTKKSKSFSKSEIKRKIFDNFLLNKYGIHKDRKNMVFSESNKGLIY